jgi:pimeloyl-ACP methyl ester carboxylesterase
VANLSLEGAQIFHEVTGDGPALVLINGGGLDCRMWQPQVGPFSAQHRVLRYDPRGIGRSEISDRSATWSPRHDLCLLLSQLGIERAHVVGLSWGGSLAIDFALDYPFMVSSLVLVAPGVSGYKHADVDRFLDQLDYALDRGDIEPAVELTLRESVDGPHRRPDQVDQHLRKALGDMYRASYERVTRGMPPQPMQPPALQRLGEIDAPTLLVVGSLDMTAIHDIASLLVTRIPNITRADIADAAHMVNLEAPEVFNARLLEFMSEVETMIREGALANRDPSSPET